MQFSEQQTEFFAMGFDDWNDAGNGLTRAKRLLNEAMHEIQSQFEWQFTETSATGTAPLTISDLHRIIEVVDSTNDSKLRYIDRRTLGDIAPDLPDTGTPEYYWLDGLTTLRVYPANTSVTLAVRYHKYPSDMSANGDVPLIPARFRPVIVYRAAAKAHRYKQNFEAAAGMEAEVNRIVDQMREALIFRGGEADFQHVAGQDY